MKKNKFSKQQLEIQNRVLAFLTQVEALNNTLFVSDLSYREHSELTGRLNLQIPANIPVLAWDEALRGVNISSFPKATKRGHIFSIHRIDIYVTLK